MQRTIFFLTFVICYALAIAAAEESLRFEELNIVDSAEAIQTYSCCNILRYVQDCKNQLICQLCSFLNDIAQSLTNSVQNYLPNYLFYCISSFLYEISYQVCNLVPYYYCYYGPWYYAQAASPVVEADGHMALSSPPISPARR
ncbi:uncharacterized protein LOC129609556 [Condylostylus longicornis]|uniref:uncharacterized protein LOC129609556 n=1 Tax=Condylostylus longicornis TaxID=2530218 RepID=UPI00244E4BFC|nr:uncharacterized protein LOC129609556 [Condylostylus longicornis]